MAAAAAQGGAQTSLSTSTSRALSRHLSGDRGTSSCSWTPPAASSARTAPAIRVRPPFPPSLSAPSLAWEFHEPSEVATEQSTRAIRSWSTATTSGSDKSRRHRTHLNKMVPSRAHSGEPSRQGMRHVWGFRKFTPTSA